MPMPTTIELLRIARRLHQERRRPQSLRALASEAGVSRFQLQRAFTALAGESPARYARRLRLLHAASQLLRGEDSLLQVARRSGFASVEVLIRNFRRDWGCTPAQYRRQLRGHPRDARFDRTLVLANRIAPCAGFYRLANTPGRTTMPMQSAALRQLPAQPSLIIRSRIPRADIAAAIGNSLGRIVPYAMGHGAALAGQPFARYPEFGPGLLTIEVGMPLAAAVAGEGDIESFTLPACTAAVAVHKGPYDRLHESYVALEQWLAQQGRKANGPPWEVYVSDPADIPDSAEWITEIVQPVL
jgi:AraC family transcriptional regulator